MNITIVGAGNIGTQFAVHCAVKGHRVTIYSKRANQINNKLTIVDEQDNILYSAVMECITNKPDVAFADADLIFICVPSTLMANSAKEIEPYIQSGAKICLTPGTGGGECAFANCISKGAIVFGLQRVPSVARLITYGDTVRCLGYRGELYVASIPHTKSKECATIIQDLFDIPCVALSNYLNVTLTPSNPILHTSRLRTLFCDYHEGVTYEQVPLFYEEWSDESSSLLLACDAEVQQICRSLETHGFDLSHVKSLKLHYESNTATELTKKIRSIASFKGLTSPTTKTDLGLVPDFSSRYFTADFSYGLTIIMQVASFFNLEVSNIKETLAWYHNLVSPESEFDYKNHNIYTLEDYISFYAQK